MLDEGHNVITMHLPASIDLRERQKRDADKQNKNYEVNETVSTTSASLLDVEYEVEEEDYSNEKEATEEPTSITNAPLKEVKEEKETGERLFSVNLWNGSPLLPNFENVKSTGGK